jgi:hypothetical protein
MSETASVSHEPTVKSLRAWLDRMVEYTGLLGDLCRLVYDWSYTLPTLWHTTNTWYRYCSGWTPFADFPPSWQLEIQTKLPLPTSNLNWMQWIAITSMKYSHTTDLILLQKRHPADTSENYRDGVLNDATFEDFETLTLAFRYLGLVKEYDELKVMLQIEARTGSGRFTTVRYNIYRSETLSISSSLPCTFTSTDLWRPTITPIHSPSFG